MKVSALTISIQYLNDTLLVLHTCHTCRPCDNVQYISRRRSKKLLGLAAAMLTCHGLQGLLCLQHFFCFSSSHLREASRSNMQHMTAQTVGKNVGPSWPFTSFAATVSWTCLIHSYPFLLTMHGYETAFAEHFLHATPCRPCPSSNLRTQVAL